MSLFIKSFFMPLACSLFLVLAKGQQPIDTVSYSIGMSIGQKLLSQGAGELNYESFARAIQDVMEGQTPLFNQRFSDSLNYIYFQAQRDRLVALQKEEGVRFLAVNGQRPEIITTESGLQYEVLELGEGPKPTAASIVTVHYEGKLLNGKIFDSSIPQDQPLTLAANRFIKGFSEGLLLMSKGAKFRFYIPQDLAYGSRGAGKAVPPYAALIFEVELLSWK